MGAHGAAGQPDAVLDETAHSVDAISQLAAQPAGAPELHLANRWYRLFPSLGGVRKLHLHVNHAFALDLFAAVSIYLAQHLLENVAGSPVEPSSKKASGDALVTITCRYRWREERRSNVTLLSACSLMA